MVAVVVLYTGELARVLLPCQLLSLRRTYNLTLKASSERADEGRWILTANHIHDPATKKPIKDLLWLSEWHERRTVASMETAKDQGLCNLPATSYPSTICWIPSSDQSTHILSSAISSALSSY